jgi:hypothetical protein
MWGNSAILTEKHEEQIKQSLDPSQNVETLQIRNIEIFVLPDVHSIDKYRSRIDVEEPEEEPGNRRLPRPGTAHNGERGAGTDSKRDLLQDLSVGQIAEADVPELNVRGPAAAAALVHHVDRQRSILHLHPLLHEIEHVLHVDKALLSTYFFVDFCFLPGLEHPEDFLPSGCLHFSYL